MALLMPSTTEPATDRQRDLIAELAAERNADVDVPAVMTEADASAIITRLLRVPRQTRRRLVAPGLYEKDGVAYRVRVSSAGHTYAEEWRIKGGEWSWKYAKSAAYGLTDDDAMSSDRAESYGLDYFEGE